MRRGLPRRRALWRRRLIAAVVLVALLAVGGTQARRHWPGDVRSYLGSYASALAAC